MAKQGFFRLGNKDSIKWDGSNIDVTHSGVVISEIRRPTHIDLMPVKSPETKTRSGSVYMKHNNDFRLIYKQGSIVDEIGAAVAMVSEVPGLMAGGGAKDVATELAKFINKQVSTIRIGVSAEITTPIIRTPEDGDRAIIVLAIANSLIKIDRSSKDIKFEAKMSMEAGRSVRWNPHSGKDTFDFQYQSNTKPAAYSGYIKDGVYVSVPASGSKLVYTTVELRAEIPELIPAFQLTKYIDKIVKELRARGLTEQSGNDEKVKKPDGANLKGFFAGLLEMLKALLNGLVRSVQDRIIAATVNTTKIEFEYVAKPPADVATELAMHVDQADSDKDGELLSAEIGGAGVPKKKIKITLEDATLSAAENAAIAAPLLKALGLLERTEHEVDPFGEEF